MHTNTHTNLRSSRRLASRRLIVSMCTCLFTLPNARMQVNERHHRDALQAPENKTPRITYVVHALPRATNTHTANTSASVCESHTQQPNDNLVAVVAHSRDDSHCEQSCFAFVLAAVRCACVRVVSVGSVFYLRACESIRETGSVQLSKSLCVLSSPSKATHLSYR